MIDDTAIREHLTGLRSTQLEADITERRNRIDQISQQNNEYTQAITRGLISMREQGRQLDLALGTAADPDYSNHLLGEWEELSKHPRLASAEVEDAILILETTDDIRLHCEDREDTRWLGAFRIHVNFGTGHISLHNQNTRRGGRDHPHVVNGNPCFGGDYATFSNLLAGGDLFMLYEMLLQYLEKLNLKDEYGAFGSYWFDIPDERPEPKGVKARRAKASSAAA